MTSQSDNLFQQQQISDFIAKVHNPSLVIPTESPNGFIIYHIYSDGEITSQKGGWAYLQRSEFTDSYSYFKKDWTNLFPIKTKNVRQQVISYAIVTREDAKRIVEMIKAYETTQ